MLGGKPVILLTGQPGVGKTTVIKQLAKKAGSRVGGFYTQEIREGKGRKGFEIVTFDGERGYLALKSACKCFEREIPFKSYRVNLGDIEGIAIPALIRAQHEGRIVFADEIGPMEITSRPFCDTIWQLLQDENVSLIGTVVRRPHPFADEVKRQPRVELIEVTHRNRSGLAGEIWKSVIE